MAVWEFVKIRIDVTAGYSNVLLKIKNTISLMTLSRQLEKIAVE